MSVVEFLTIKHNLIAYLFINLQNKKELNQGILKCLKCVRPFYITIQYTIYSFIDTK